MRGFWRRQLARIAVLSVLSTSAVIVAAPLGASASTPQDITDVVSALHQFAAFSHALSTDGPLGQPVPDTGLIPGGPDALSFGDLFDQSVATPADAAAPGSSGLGDLAHALTGPITFAGTDPRSGTVTATSGSNGGLETLTITDKVNATNIKAPLKIDNTDPLINVSSQHGLSVDVKSTLSVEFDYNPTTHFVSIPVSPAPSLSVTINGHLLDGAAAGIGVLGATVSNHAQSPVTINAGLTGKFSAAQGSNQYAFTQPSSGPAATLLTTSNAPSVVGVTYDSPSPFNGTFDITPATTLADGTQIPGLEGLSTNTESVTISDPDLATNPIPAITGPGFSGELADFETMTPHDLMDGLGQLRTAIRAILISKGSHGDVALPFLHGSLSDAVPAEQGLTSFLIDHSTTTQASSDPAHPTQTVNEPDFSSLQEMFTELHAEHVPDGTISISHVGYSGAKHTFGFTLELSRDSHSPQDLDPRPTASGPSPEQVDPGAGAVDIADSLRAKTGLDGIAAPTGAADAQGHPAPPESLAKVTPSYDLTIPLTINLATPVTGDACKSVAGPGQLDASNAHPSGQACPYDETDALGHKSGLVVTELPLPNDRFSFDPSNFTLTADAPITTAQNGLPGHAGYAGVVVDASISVTPSGSGHELQVTLNPPASALDPDHNLSFDSLFAELGGGSSSVVHAVQAAQAAASLKVTVPCTERQNAGPCATSFFGSGSSTTVDVSLPDITQSSMTVGDASDPHALDKLLALDSFNNSQSVASVVVTDLRSLGTGLADATGSSSSVPITHSASGGTLASTLPLFGTTFGQVLDGSSIGSGAQAALGTGSAVPGDLQSLLDDFSTSAGFQPVGFTVDTSGSTPLLELHLANADDVTVSAPLQFADGTGGTFVSQAGQQIALDDKRSTNITYDIPLAATGSPKVDTSSTIGSTVSTDVHNGQYDGTIGSLNLRLGNHDGVIKGAMSLTGQDSSDTGSVGLDTWLQHLSVSSDPTANTTCAGVTAPGNSAFCADLTAYQANSTTPLFGTGNDDFLISVDSTDPTTMTEQEAGSDTPATVSGGSGSGGGGSSTALDQQVSHSAIDISNFSNGFSSLFDQLLAGLGDVGEDGKLPFLGAALSSSSSPADQFVATLQSKLTSKFSAIGTPTGTAQNVADAVSGAISSLNGQNGISVTAVHVAVACSDSSDCHGGSEGADKLVSIEPSFTITGETTVSLPFDIGLPGLSLTSGNGGASALSAKLTWTLNLDVGISKQEGFFVAPGSQPALQVGATVDVPSADGSGLRLQLAFVQVQATQHGGGNPHLMDAHFGVALTGPSHITIANLAQAGIRSSFTGGVHVDWDLNACAAVSGGGGCKASALPGLTSEFKFDWHLGGGSDADTSHNPFSSTPSIEFDNVSLDAGAFLSGALGGVGKEIQSALGPIKPVVDTVTAPIPVLTDLSHLVGGPDITLLELAKLYGEGSGDSDTVDAIARVVNLVHLVDKLSGAATGSPINFGTFKLAGDQVDQDQLTPAGADNAIQSGGTDASSLKQAVGDAYGDANFLDSFTSNTDGGFDFPLFNDPRKIMDVLLGRDEPIVTYDTGKLSVGFSYKQDFGPIWPFPPVFVTLSGAASISAELKVGVDTSGIRQAVENGQAFDSIGGALGGLVSGFYIDTDASNVVLTGDIAAGAEINVVIASAGAEGGISLTLNIGLRPNTPTPGRFYLFKATQASNFFCIFTIKGNISAFLDVYVSIDLLFYSHTWHFPVASVTLDDFSSSCPSDSAPPPVLAEVVDTGSDKTLVLNVGNFGTDAYRGKPWGNDHSESGAPGPYYQQGAKVVVRQLAANSYQVSMLGQYQTFTAPNLDRVYADSTNSSYQNTIQLAGSGDQNGAVTDFTAKTAVFAGSGGDTLIAGDGPVIFQGGAGPDTVTAGNGGNLISGGPGPDKITSGNGGDTILGDAPLPALTATAGPLAGHPDPNNVGTPDDKAAGAETPTDGDDLIVDGAGENLIYGNGGNDQINASQGAQQGLTDPAKVALGSTIIGGTGSNTIQGSLGPDHIWTGQRYAGDQGPEFSGPANDGNGNFVDSGPGTDVVYGSSGDDTIVGHSTGQTDPSASTGREFDTFYGAGGTDSMSGGDGPDQIFGGPGDDVVSGGPALIKGRSVSLTPDHKAVYPKLLVGGSGKDVIYGANDTGDTIYGDQTDENCVLPSPGPDGTPLPPETNDPSDPTHRVSDAGDDEDTIVGGSGKDEISGGGGNDNITTGTGDDDACGLAGSDVIVGQSTPTQVDRFTGGAGDDSVTGGSGKDLLFGGSGEDTINTGAGADYAEGGPDSDALFGQSVAGQTDRLIGGTSLPATSDSYDEVFGGAGDDVLLGDNGIIPASGAPTEYDLTADPSAGYGGNDFVSAGSGHDLVLGGLADDFVEGAGGSDVIEGGPGCDLVAGDAGDDDLIGGSSPAYLAAGLTGDQVPDGCDSARNDITTGQLGSPPSAITGNTIYGDDFGTADSPSTVQGYQDEIVGGNGSITETGNTTAPDQVPVRTVVQMDVAGLGGATDKSVVGGDDTIVGGPGDDGVFAGVGSDRVYAGSGDNYVEGGPGGDRLEGGVGNNDIIGGSSPVALPPGVTTGQMTDGGDTVYADGIESYAGSSPSDGGDAVLGDNGSIARPNPWTYQSADPNSAPTPARTVVQLDSYDCPVSGCNADVQGAADTIFGGFGDDQLFGETGDDRIATAPPGAQSTVAANNHDDSDGQRAGDDYVEGGMGSDTIAGAGGADDLIGGVSTGFLAPGRNTESVSDGTGPTAPRVGNTVDGGGGNDVIVGGHGVISHPLVHGVWQQNPNDGAFVRVVTQCDMAASGAGGRSVTCDRAQLGGADQIRGGSGDDLAFAGVGGDAVDGGPGDDYLEGNLGSDVIDGGTGRDDVVGGTSPIALPAPDGASGDQSQYLQGLAAALGDGTTDSTVSGQLDGNVLCGYECGQSTTAADDDEIIGNNGEIDRCPNVVGTRTPDLPCSWAFTGDGLDRAGKVSLGTELTRYPTLLGESTAPNSHAANDYIEGNSGNDNVFGEDGADSVHGDTPNQSSPAVLAWTAAVAPGVISANECLATSDATAGQDTLLGGYGDDLACGDGGQDALVGDRGSVTIAPFSGPTTTIASGGPPFLTRSYPASGNTIYRVSLIDSATGGNDTLFGGQGDDSMHGGAGKDFLEGDDGLHVAGQAAATGGNDILFGDDGQDSLLGGPGANDGFGGYNEDDLDVQRGSAAAPKFDNDLNPLSPRYPTIATYTAAFPLPTGRSYDSDPVDTATNPIANIDYGGYDRDLLQAADNTDRLVDEIGNYNLFYVCTSSYGEAEITRSLSPGVRNFMTSLSAADGAVGSSAGNELSLVTPGSPNNARAYPGTPGHFTCPA